MKRIKDGIKVLDNPLVFVVYDPHEKRTFRQGKRVKPDCPLDRDERRDYVKRGIFGAHTIAKKRGIKYHAALEVLKEACGGRV